MAGGLESEPNLGLPQISLISVTPDECWRVWGWEEKRAKEKEESVIMETSLEHLTKATHSFFP